MPFWISAHSKQGTHMDLHDQRIACLRMAIDMGCTPDTAVQVAMDLMGFVASGTLPPPSKAATPDPVAACGTVLAAPAAAELTATPATEATPERQAAAPESGATDGAPSSRPAGAASAAPLAAPSPPPVALTGIAVAEVTVVPSSLEPAAAGDITAVAEPARAGALAANPPSTEAAMDGSTAEKDGSPVLDPSEPDASVAHEMALPYAVPTTAAAHNDVGPDVQVPQASAPAPEAATSPAAPDASTAPAP